MVVTKERSSNYENLARLQWLTTIILATWEAEIQRTIIPGQHRQKFHKIPSQPVSGHSGVCLSSQLCRKLKYGGSWFQSRLGNKFTRPHLNRK
jgi:hypothetical protein